jgi:HD-GYP domain-containing protein (c-di-GMP phosphodiesterase class II)
MKMKMRDISTSEHSERISEMATALAKEYDLADRLAKAIRGYLDTNDIPERLEAERAVMEWQVARNP